MIVRIKRLRKDFGIYVTHEEEEEDIYIYIYCIVCNFNLLLHSNKIYI